jgi:hypothetical protein
MDIRNLITHITLLMKLLDLHRVTRNVIVTFSKIKCNKVHN